MLGCHLPEVVVERPALAPTSGLNQQASSQEPGIGEGLVLAPQRDRGVRVRPYMGVCTPWETRIADLSSRLVRHDRNAADTAERNKEQVRGKNRFFASQNARIGIYRD